MATYTFTGQNAAGAKVAGQRESTSTGALARELKTEGVLPLSIEEQDTPQNKQQISAKKRGTKIRANEIILFSHQMRTLMKAGISVVHAIRGLADSQANPEMGYILKGLTTQLESGQDFATSLGRYPKTFSNLYVSVIHLGENTGRLDEAFGQIAHYLELEEETSKRIKSATRYPMFVIGAIGIAMVIMNIFVIPTFSEVFKKFDAELPWQTQMLIGVSNFFVNYWWLLLLAGISAVYFGRQYLAKPAGRYQWDKIKLKTPIVGSIFERIVLGRFCQTFAIVSRAGLPVNTSLNIIARVLGNEFLAAKVLTMRDGVERGVSILQTARDSQMFTPTVLQMISVGEETGSMSELLEQAAGFYEEEVDYQLKGMTEAIEPILIIAIGGMVLVLALGVFLPLWDLSGVANS